MRLECSNTFQCNQFAIQEGEQSGRSNMFIHPFRITYTQFVCQEITSVTASTLTDMLDFLVIWCGRNRMWRSLSGDKEFWKDLLFSVPPPSSVWVKGPFGVLS